MKIIKVDKEKNYGRYIIYFDNGGRLNLYNENPKYPSWLYLVESYDTHSKEIILQAVKSLEVWAEVLEKIPFDDIDIGTDTLDISVGIPLTFEIRDKILNKTLKL